MINLKDCLDEFCNLLNIKLIYKASKQIILSCGFEKEIPCIKLDNIFMNCPYEISNAIIGYCIDIYDKEKYLRTLKDFARKKLLKTRFEFNLPSKKFISCVLKRLIEFTSGGKVIPTSDEMNIISVKGKDFYSNKYDEIDYCSINVANDNLMELEIIVSPFDT